MALSPRDAALKVRLDALYLQYDVRHVSPDPLEFVRRQGNDADREVAGLVASSLAFGGVPQIKRSIERVLAILGPRPAEGLSRLSPRQALSALGGFKHRWSTARDVACLLWYARQMRERSGTIEAFFAEGAGGPEGDLAEALASFSARALALDHASLYGPGPLPRRAGVRYFFPSPKAGGACKRLNLYLRWMVRREGVDLGVWRSLDPARLVIPLDAHVLAIARRVRLTRYRSPGWPMALDITRRLRRLDPADPVKYDFAFHRMGLWRKDAEIEGLRARRTRAQPTGASSTTE